MDRRNPSQRHNDHKPQNLADATLPRGEGTGEYTVAPAWIDTANRTRTWVLRDPTNAKMAEITAKRDAEKLAAVLNSVVKDPPLPSNAGRPPRFIESTELYRDGLEVLLPEGAVVVADIPEGFDGQGKPTGYQRIEGVIEWLYTIDTPTEGGPAQAWYSVHGTLDGLEGSYLAQTKHIRRYRLLVSEDEPSQG